MQARFYEFLLQNRDIELLICKSEDAQQASDVALLLGYKSFVLPNLAVFNNEDLTAYQGEIFDLLSTLNNYIADSSDKKILISPFKTLLNPMPKKRFFKTKSISFADRIDIQKLKEELLLWGYSFRDIVQSRGEVSFRGDIIDIFPINSHHAFRISLFDFEVEDIKQMQTQTQKSKKETIESISIPPAFLALDEQEYNILQEKIDNFQTDSLIKDLHSIGFWVLDNFAHYYQHQLNSYSLVSIDDISKELSYIKKENLKELYNIKIIDFPKKYKDISIIDLKDFLRRDKGRQISIILKSNILLDRLEIANTLEYKKIYLDVIVNIASDKDVVLSLNSPKKQRKIKIPSIILDELDSGDLVVHQQYGIGLFKGLMQITAYGITKDYAVITYLDDDRLLLPVEHIDLIDRYIAKEEGENLLDKLGRKSFQTLKAKIRKKLFAIAKELVDSAAKRQLQRGYKIDTNIADIDMFRQDANFTYTQDQAKSIEDIFSDISSGDIMDRLLCGDAGFGKTEVAMNAMFAVAKSKYQSLFMAPTTLLANQHFITLKDRLSKYNIKVERLDGFTLPKQRAKIIKNLEDKKIDICVGTHALLNLKLDNLALLVLDEEHKFGVKQKDKLRHIRENIHVLSMSATPIPRSLNLALSSIKGYTQILTPPKGRQDVRTFVKQYNESLFKEIFIRELKRGGQILFIHNRIQTIEDKKEELLSIFPSLKILVLHSKIGSIQTQKNMIDFQNRKYDLLLCTTIIESGIHLPNANTIIVDNADRFGMADLYQLRGRVGRSETVGFCYFLIKDKNIITKNAKKRLLALENHSFLGSGSVLAFHDLEIRGGGNIVGEAQSGHIKGVGYALYVKMLEDSINELMHKNTSKDNQIDIKLMVNAYINKDLIPEDRIRLELYRRLSHCDSVDLVYDIEDEIIDRFGRLDDATKRFLNLIVAKLLCIKKSIIYISGSKSAIAIKYSNKKSKNLKINAKNEDELIQKILEFLRRDN